ncbi:predicted ATPase, AAA superfamily, containing PIN and KH nucleic acid-binding domains [Thermococcus kodakarensis KOD1]|uniref:Predicted ATPase, AAA superfamily, containing PIN and KH nucleic acid-binding domains n=1 Tax=Thermococcus kodakarensis (strain ATCC BAA-918 / JCM 12380 / KOD1) TaxID=69014 RepID=Q5JI99_THEKO|nr:PINc/VapC family ATPase [Thermococcus kodakarensis]WCN29254.1 PINc/VapC family ATPase [Thermococcus kodakarensis]WCN31237.1 PINc/VapC family ATPase [Thermococcus kodakarensis]BAD85142.1 predicted ATPase, AAA superfamily, containing PIN and KH nucleic acid-binding domains [Thermococcus kodakarensis KOD1]
MRVLVPDTSVIVDGRLTQFLSTLGEKVKVVVPEAVVAEIEHQANEGKAIGHVGLEELKKLREMADRGEILLEFYGERPDLWQIRRAKAGEIDNMVREVAQTLSATLVTGDQVQRDIAIAKGIDVIYLTTKKEVRHRLEDFFDDTTMSVHLKAGIRPLAKKGRPGEWRLVPVRDEPLTDVELEEIADDIVERAKRDPESFIELDEPGATVVQLRNYRIVIAKPPFSDRIEITAVRPITKLSIEDYELSERLLERLRDKAAGILIAGAPGEGKTTFAQALAEWYASMGKIVKTMEKPRDLQVSEEITQYTALKGSMELTGDILLLVRPDYTIFDEMRKTSDFKIYSDLRLAGVGMIGVVHATKPIDAIQRFIGRVELGMIPQIVDTVIFIKAGRVAKVLTLEYLVKVPSGMKEEDLARPVIEVRDFETGELEYEIYTYGEEVSVVPVKKEEKAPALRLAEKRLKQEIKKFLPDVNAEVEIVSPHKAVIYADEFDIPAIIGKKGKRITELEKRIGISIDVKSFAEREELKPKERIPVEVEEKKKTIVLRVSPEYAKKPLKFYGGEQYVFTATPSRKGLVKVSKSTPIGKELKRLLDAGIPIWAST